VIPENRPLAPDVFLMLGTKITLLVLQTLVTIIVARELGTSGRGAVAVAFSFSILLINFGALGLQTANPFFAAQDPTRIGRIVANSLWLALAIGSVLILIGVVIKLEFPAVLQGLDWLEVGVVLIGLPITLASMLLQNVLLAEGRMKAYNGIELAITLLVTSGLWVGLHFLGMGPLGAIVWIVSVNAMGALTFLALLMRHKPAVRQPDLDLARQMLKYGFRVYVASVVAFLVFRVNLLLVNSYLGNSDAGLFSVAAAMAEAMHVIPTVVAINLFPRIARGAEFDFTALVFRSVTVLFALVCLASVPLAGPAIHVLFGTAYAGVKDIYLWMLPGIFCYGTLNVLAYHFAGRGYPLEAVLIWFPGMAINLAIVMIWVPGHGAWVAALAASVACGIVLVLHMRMFAKESGGYRALIPRPAEVARLLIDSLRSLRPRVAG
jgi:O-antigen/teichoic acid export membrane protein